MGVGLGLGYGEVEIVGVGMQVKAIAQRYALCSLHATGVIDQIGIGSKPCICMNQVNAVARFSGRCISGYGYTDFGGGLVCRGFDIYGIG